MRSYMQLPHLLEKQRQQVRAIRAQHPRLFAGVFIGYIVFVCAVIGWAVAFAYSVASSLPDEKVLKSAARMADASLTW